jgi:CheY-like chemotaxis protein/two-component sensor histidine kinase
MASIFWLCRSCSESLVRSCISRSISSVRAWLEEVRKASDRAANLTRQLLAFSRQQVLRPQVLDIAHEIREFENLLGPLLGERIRLTVRAEPGLGFVFAAASAINQIVMNLALNARDAMPRGGDLEIALRARPDAASETLRGDGAVELSVRDTGVGMDEATRAKMFEPFFTTKEPGKGSGLGLAQVDGLVEQCGGTIEVESEPGKGTIFRVFLPRVRAEQPALESSPQPAVGGRGERILLVEDEPLVRKLLEQLLSRAGYQVTATSDPVHALTLTQGPARFDAIVSDVVMANLSGPELAERIEAGVGPVPTVFMSGHTEDEFIRKGAIRGHQRFLSKPFAPQELLQRLREVLDPSRAGGSAKI